VRMRVRQLRDRSARTLQLTKVSHAEVEGYQAQAQELAQMLLGKLPELELEFIW